ncbi:MAG: hypothetical protein M3O26_10610 [Pseudomonadota bacterium]|nr:hypothetical protein [Pseudomonadota bacterium]
MKKPIEEVADRIREAMRRALEGDGSSSTITIAADGIYYSDPKKAAEVNARIVRERKP